MSINENEKDQSFNEQGASEFNIASDNRRRRILQEELVHLEDKEYTYKQLNRVLHALDAFKKGDVSVRLQKENDDIFADIAEAYNSMVEMIGGVGGEVSRISKVAGVEGNLKARASAGNASGFWKDMISKNCKKTTFSFHME